MSRRSVGRIDHHSKPKSKSKTTTLAHQLGLEHVIDDLVTTKVVRKSEEELYIDLVKADNGHLPEGAERFAYKVPNQRNVIYIPVNRLKQIYQTDEATNPRKVAENKRKMKAGIPLKPIEIGYNYDIHDGHHRWEAATELGHTHVPCVVVGTDPDKVKEAREKYKEVWKSEELYIDLAKALNTAKLVKRMVQVRGQGGKIFTRMQWVDPHDASTGQGVRKVSSEEDLQRAHKHGIDQHPGYHQALQDQGVDLQHHDFKKHPHFYLPETEHSRKQIEQEHDAGHFKKDSQGVIQDKHGEAHHIPDGKEDPTHYVYDQEEYPDAADVGDKNDEKFKHLYEGTPVCIPGPNESFRAGMMFSLVQDQVRAVHKGANPYGDLRTPYLWNKEVFGDITRQGIEQHLSKPGEFSVTVEEVTPRYSSVHGVGSAMLMKLKDNNGMNMGHMERHIFKHPESGDYHIENELFELDGDHHGKGSANHLYAKSEELWKHMANGNDATVGVYANISVGQYAWATKGFDFENDSERHQMARDLQKFLGKHGLDEEEVMKASGKDSIDDLQTPHDFATLDNGKAWDLSEARDARGDKPFKGTAHLGKAFLLLGASPWAGAKKL